MASSDSKKFGFWDKVSLKFVLLRKSLLKRLLAGAQIIQIRGHWIYIKDLNSDSVIVDLGANEGLFSKEVYELSHSSCFAVEPNVLLYNNIKNEFITKLNYAVTSTDGPIDFYISNNNEASSIVKDFENIWGNETKVTVEGLSFKSLVDKLNIGNKGIEILKIDIEGAELALIESFSYEDIENVKQITIEFHDWINMGLHDRTVAAINKLISFGFETYTDTPNHKWPVEMLFLNKKLTQLDTKQKFFIKIFKQAAFLNYQ